MQDFSPQLAELSRRLGEARQYLRIEEAAARRPQLETELGRPDLWDDAESAQQIQREFAEVDGDLQLYAELETAIEDTSVLAEMAREEGDESQEPEIQGTLDALSGRFDELELRVSPVLVGGGTPYFPPLRHRADLRLVESRTLSGVVLLRYERVRSG